MHLLAFIFLFGYNMIKYDYFLGDENMSAVIEKIISNVKQHPDQVVIVGRNSRSGRGQLLYLPQL